MFQAQRHINFRGPQQAQSLRGPRGTAKNENYVSHVMSRNSSKLCFTIFMAYQSIFSSVVLCFVVHKLLHLGFA